MYVGSIVLISMCVLHAFSTRSWKQQFRYISKQDIRVSNVDGSFTDVTSMFHCATHCNTYSDKLTSGTCVSFGYNEVSKTCEVNRKPLDFETVSITTNEVGWKLWESYPCGLAIAIQQSGKCMYMIALQNTFVNWYVVDSFCRDMGSHMSLVKIESEAENAALNIALNMAYDGPDFWGWVSIGANKVNTSWYVWTDETPITYDNFAATFIPQVAGDGCVVVYITDAECIWGDKTCSEAGSFVCQRLLN